jgi:hypothetical protein
LENDLKEKAEEIVVLTSKKDGLISDITTVKEEIATMSEQNIESNVQALQIL